MGIAGPPITKQPHPDLVKVVLDRAVRIRLVVIDVNFLVFSDVYLDHVFKGCVLEDL